MTAPTRSAIPTTYRGTNFRSRLEARWAAFFDLVGWRWTYEPFDAGGYIPDFLIHGNYSFLIEVGPCVSEEDYAAKTVKADARADTLGRDVVVVGVSPVMRPDPYGDGHPVVGMHGEHHGQIDLDFPIGAPPEPAGFVWNAGVWGICFRKDCRALGVVHTEMNYSLRPCGHHQSGGFGEDVAVEFLEGIWARAGNDTQWMPESVGTIMRRLGR